MEKLRYKSLAPLDDLPDATRARLEETLRSWLRCLGDRRSMAQELSIHPQTVRYRMAQLHDAFGDALDSPRSRMRLFLAPGVATWGRVTQMISRAWAQTHRQTRPRHP